MELFMIRQTILTTVSIGIVAKDILEDDMYVDVYPIELHPDMDGELTSRDTLTNTVTDARGGVSNITTTKSPLIKAKWMPDGDTNRLEPPTVCKDEIVRLYRYGDTERYYWNTLYNQLDRRKLEKRTIVVSNKQSINVPIEDLLEYTYSSSMDTINKLVHLRTSDTDGEYTTYDIAIDTAEGQLEITDGKNNFILLESQDDRWTVTSNKEIITNTVDTVHHSTESITSNTKVSENNSSDSITNNTKVTENNSSDSLTNNVGTKTDNVDTRYVINLKSYEVHNGSDELIAVLSDFVQAVHDAIGTGNVGFPVPMDPGTQTALSAIKAKIDGFK